MARLKSTEINGNLNIIGDLHIEDTTVADYIVEQGTDGIWTYRKWNSGIAECWRITDSMDIDYDQEWYGLLYYTSLRQDFPSGLFTQVSNISINTICAGGIHASSIQEFDTAHVVWYQVAHTGLAFPHYSYVRFNISVKGRWK